MHDYLNYRLGELRLLNQATSNALQEHLLETSNYQDERHVCNLSHKEQEKDFFINLFNNIG